MQEIKIILLPPANAQRVKISHRPSSFFPFAQLRKSKCSSECPPVPSRAAASCSALTIPLLLRLTTPSRHLSETANIFCSRQRCAHMALSRCSLRTPACLCQGLPAPN